MKINGPLLHREAAYTTQCPWHTRPDPYSFSRFLFVGCLVLLEFHGATIYEAAPRIIQRKYRNETMGPVTPLLSTLEHLLPHDGAVPFDPPCLSLRLSSVEIGGNLWKTWTILIRLFFYSGSVFKNYTYALLGKMIA